jgi:hypothetical protein
VRDYITYLYKLIFLHSFYHTQTSRKFHFLFRFRNHNSVWNLTATLRSTYPTNLIILNLMTVTILGYDAPHFDFLRSPITFPILCKNIIFGTQFTNTLYLRLYLCMTDKLKITFISEVIFELRYISCRIYTYDTEILIEIYSEYIYVYIYTDTYKMFDTNFPQHSFSPHFATSFSLPSKFMNGLSEKKTFPCSGKRK